MVSLDDPPVCSGNATHEALVKERERNRGLRVEVEHLLLAAAKLASINLSLLSNLAVCEEAPNGKVVFFAPLVIPSR